MYNMKILSTDARSLCHQLRKLLQDPPPTLVIGRLVDGPQQWFQWKGSNQLQTDYGWEQEYYHLIACLKQKCQVEHFAVSMTYMHEVTPEVKLISATKITDQGILHFKSGEPIQIIPSTSNQRGYLAQEKLQFWLNHWDDVKQYFHGTFYVLMGEDAHDDKSHRDVLFHYHGDGLRKVARSYNKKLTRVRENFVTEQKEADIIIKMFHTTL